MAHLEAGQFDMTWEAQWDENRLAIPESCRERLEEDWEVQLKGSDGSPLESGCRTGLFGGGEKRFRTCNTQCS